MAKKEADLTIVYDDAYLEIVANRFSNGLAGKYTCAVQRYSVFEKEKDTYSNNNRVFFIFKDASLMDDCIGAIRGTEYTITQTFGVVYVSLFSMGNRRGIWVNVEKTISSFSKKDRLDLFCFKCFGPIMRPFFGYNARKAIESDYYRIATDFFLENENLKLILPD